MPVDLYLLNLKRWFDLSQLLIIIPGHFVFIYLDIYRLCIRKQTDSNLIILT